MCPVGGKPSQIGGIYAGSIDISPADILKWWHTLSAGWRIVTALVAPFCVGGLLACLLVGLWNHERLAHWKDLVEEYKERAGGSPDQVRENLQRLRDELNEEKKWKWPTLSAGKRGA